jgi:vacuolar-type H+-ATPase subunit F/Vma7
MACAIYQGYSNDCRDNQGGIKKVYIANLSNVTVTSASGAVSAITMAGSTKFYTYEQELNVANAVEVITGNRQAGTLFVDQTVNIMMNKKQSSLAYQIMAIAQTNVVIVVEQANGKLFLYGQNNGLALDPSNAPTGTTMADRNGYELVFKGQETTLANEIPLATWTTFKASYVV